MPFIKKNNIDFSLVDNEIKLSDDYIKSNAFRFKKITGTRFASILNLNKYTSPVKMWSMMVNIYNEPMDDMYALAGNIIEPKIHRYICDKLKIEFKQYVPNQIGWDVFKENKIYGGIPDGEPIDLTGKFLYPEMPMLEIKTTSIDSFKFKKEGNNFVLCKDENNNPIVKNIGEKKKSWFDINNEIIIPNEYKFQLGLYCYLRNITKGVFAICFLETDDYINPTKVDINKREIKIVDFNLEREQFSQFVNFGEQWYKKYILKGTSPKLSNDDLIWFNNEVKG